MLPGVTLAAPAKVNLALHVTGRRADGYHLLDSVVVFADVSDRIAIERADALSLVVEGPFAAHAPGDRSDLAWRAAEAFFAEACLPPAASIRIEKNIPAGAGLGGGSADAAAVLAGLNMLFAANLPDAKLAAIGLALGADVPMCLAGRALRAGGIGEAVEPLPDWPALPLVLVWPARAVATAEVFRTLARRDNAPLGAPPRACDAATLADWLADCRNDLEVSAKAAAPEIGASIAVLGKAGASVARMSGSGSACFGIFRNPAEAERAAAAIRQQQPGWWVTATLSR